MLLSVGASAPSEKARVHNHYLKSSLFCGLCMSRLIIHYSTNSAGVVYPYFVCIGRHQKRTNCTMSAINIHDVEQQVENLYKLVAITPEGAAMTKSRLKAAMEAGTAEAKRTQQVLLTQQTSLMERSKKLDGHLDGTIPGQLYREEQERVNHEMSVVSDRLGALKTEFEVLEQNLDDAIALAENCNEAYRRAPDALRRTYNQAFFKRILITRDESVEGVLAEPFASIVTVPENRNGTPPEGEAPCEGGSYEVICSKETGVVDLRGFEPLTSSMRTRRATNCATGPEASTLPRPIGPLEREAGSYWPEARRVSRSRTCASIRSSSAGPAKATSVARVRRAVSIDSGAACTTRSRRTSSTAA